jgi:hypothetical protein
MVGVAPNIQALALKLLVNHPLSRVVKEIKKYTLLSMIQK